MVSITQALIILGRVLISKIAQHAEHESGCLKSRRTTTCLALKPAIYRGVETDESRVAVRLNIGQETHGKCHIPYDFHHNLFLPISSYDVGENLLFGDRAEELIMHGPFKEIQLPKKKPDRIFGLKKTKNFAKILDVDGRDSNDALRCSPFKDSNDPLLFPFLIYEAKPEKMSVGFEETQTQTALPIWELLKLQESVRTDISGESHSTNPLVWFFASRGDSWRVYGCYITQNELKQYVSLNTIVETS